MKTKTGDRPQFSARRKTVVCPRFFFAACLACSTLAAARLVEEQTTVAAQVVDRYGKEVRRDLVVTIFREDTMPAPYPLLILNHGRSGTAVERGGMGRVRYLWQSRWLAELGFLVAVPTRIGYGITGGDDVEYSGQCLSKDYAAGFAASTAETVAVLEHLRSRKDAARDRAVVMGQSFGGTTAVTFAALNVAGVQAAINLAGGGGGDPKDRPGDPCDAPQLKKLFASYGKTARIPTLWIYTENDLYFGPKLPREWFEAFRAAGGQGEFELYPPHGENGHLLFSRGPELWQPRVLAFLRAHGYPDLREKPPR
jgi:dienelactone hydrolase